MKSMTFTLLSTPLSRKLFSPVERTPFAEKPPPSASRAPFSAGTTPGDKRARNVNVRWPPRGSSTTCCSIQISPMAGDSVCRSGAAAVTSTV